MLSIGEILALGEELIIEFLNEIKGELITYLDTEGRNATGKSKKSIQVANVTPKSGQLIGADHIEFVFRGRGPGQMPPLFAIIQWCATKGIPRSAAWIIAKRIQESGTNLHRSGRNILNEVLTEQRINEFINKLTAVYAAKIKSDIESLLVAA